ncbi:MAG: hypothetical protein Q9213_004577 [Squamulea squamosa]
MAKYSQAPDELRPSVMQWNALIKACAGSQPTTLPSLPRYHPSPLSLQTVGKTYVLKELFRYEHSNLHISRSGRLDWKHALSSVFGSDFKKLLTVSRAFGLALGNAARILKAIASPEAGIPPEIYK